MSRKSPFAIQKALKGVGGDPKSVKKLHSGDLLIETVSALQSKSFLLARTFIDSTLTVTPHKSLNSCRGVISEPDLLRTSEAEILKGLSDQGVTQVRRITILRDSTRLPTKHIILTFNSPKLPTTIKAGYLNCKIRPYIPNHLRCFKCQSQRHLLLFLPFHIVVYHSGKYLALRISSIKPTTQIESRLPEPISSSAAPDNTQNTSASSLSAENRPLTTEIQPLAPLPESIPTTSYSEHCNAPEILQCVKRNSRNRRKRPKVLKAEIEIKMAPHRPRKSAPKELTTVDEDMITYDVEEEELEPDPAGKYHIQDDPLNFPKRYLRSLTPSRYRNSRG
ncbi:uncharacterized protein TNCV_35461 [Trichonephila clavipes]|nr:uncharacterized protein TNCV_35461 [Trichonephila clavipes]